MKNLRELRKQKGLSQATLAKEIGAAQVSVSDWEKGRFEPSLEMLSKLADYFDVSINYLLGKEETALPAVAPTVIVQRREVKFTDKGAYDSTASLAEIEQAIYDDLEDIKHSFFQIGYKLSIICHSGKFRKLGFEDISDYAEARFGFGKSTTYNMMSVYHLAADFNEPTKMQKEFLPFNYSQLTEMARLNVCIYSMVKPEDTVAEIKKFVSMANNLYRRTGSTPRESTVKEFLQNNGVTVAALTSKRPVQVNDVAPGQTSIFEEAEEDHIEEVAPEEVDDFQYHQEPEEVDVVESPAEEISQSEEQPTKLFKEKIYSTPGRIKEAIKIFINDVCYRIIFDPDHKGMGVRVTTETFADQLKDFILEHWEEIFSNSGISL